MVKRSLKCRVALVVFALAALVAAVCASVPSEGDRGYWSQFRCEGDCGEGSGCPYCDDSWKAWPSVAPSLEGFE